MENDYVLKGNIAYAPTPERIETVEGGYLVVRNGKLCGIERNYEGGMPLVDYGGAIIIPGLCDMHVHASQYAIRGVGMDMELLDWLNAYTFPEEAKFADAVYAKEIYGQFARALVKSGTTRACVYATVHTDTALLLADELERAGVSAYVGKVSMDRNAPTSLVEGTGRAIEEAKRFAAECEAGSGRVKPILTPRFVPACSGALLNALGGMARDYGLPVQSHLSENANEVRMVCGLEPECGTYGAVYAKYGLMGEGVKSIMAHCVHSSAEEVELLAKSNVLVAHCPDSNANLASGMADVSAMIEAGVSVALGSDIAGGCTVSILDAMAKAVRTSKLSMERRGGKAITFERAFYMGTSQGSEFFGEGAGFAIEQPFHAVAMSSEALPKHDLSIAERLQRLVYLYEDRKIEAVYANGAKIY